MRYWTEEELEILQDNCGIISNKELACKLGRTHGAVRNKLYLLKLSVFSPNYYTARTLGKELGKCHDIIMDWYNAGLLKGKRANWGRGYLKSPMIFLEKHIVEFLKRYPHKVKVEKINNPYFRNIVSSISNDT
jgi:hypothetical protein